MGNGYEGGGFRRLSHRRHRRFGPLRPSPGADGRQTFGRCFSKLFEQPIDLASATVCECTRSCIRATARSSASIRNAVRLSFEINLAVCELGLRAGRTQILAAYDQFMVKAYDCAAWGPTPLARSTRIGKLPALPVWDVTQRTLAEIRKASRIERSVLEAPAPDALRAVSQRCCTTV